MGWRRYSEETLAERFKAIIEASKYGYLELEDIAEFVSMDPL